MLFYFIDQKTTNHKFCSPEFNIQ